MDRIRRSAEISVGRGSAFALLAIATFAIGMAGEPPLAVRAAAILLTLMGVVLWRMGLVAHGVPYRRREVWLMLERRHGLPEDRAHQMISTAVQDALLAQARRIGWAAAACWSLDLGTRLFG